MKFPAVPRVFLLIIFIFGSEVFAADGPGCGGGAGAGGSRSAYCDAYKKTYAIIAGGTPSSTESEFRNQRLKHVTGCCSTASGSSSPENISTLCAMVLNGGERLGTASGAAGGGVFGAMVGDKKNNTNARDIFDRYAGSCRAIGDVCVRDAETLMLDADKTTCQSGANLADRYKSQADAYSAAADATNPDYAGGGGGSAGAGGGGAGGGETQANQGGAGGGGQNPLQSLMSALQQAMQPKQDQTQEPQSMDCESNPSLSHCPVKRPENDSWNKKTGDSGFESASSGGEGADNFNVGGNDGMKTNSYGGNPATDQKLPPASGGAGVPNGGGGMPGGGGGAAGVGANAATGGTTSGPQKKLTDIMQGTMGGGYSQMNQGMKMENGAAGGGFSGYGGGAARNSEIRNGMDLRQFLPGGKNDPTRKIAGGAASFQIQPQTVNIWNRISERIRARCTQGLLRDCGP